MFCGLDTTLRILNLDDQIRIQRPPHLFVLWRDYNTSNVEASPPTQDSRPYCGTSLGSPRPPHLLFLRGIQYSACRVLTTKRGSQIVQMDQSGEPPFSALVCLKGAEYKTLLVESQPPKQDTRPGPVWGAPRPQYSTFQ